MKILISHRGNVNGKQPDKENTVAYIEDALEKGYHCEIDVCKYDGEKFYLGHDEPDTPVTTKIAEFIKQPKVFVHAKDIESIPALLTMGCNVFFHKTDNVVFTSRGQIWCYPGKYVRDIRHAIWLDLDWSPIDPDRKLNCLAVCGDRYDKKYG